MKKILMFMMTVIIIAIGCIFLFYDGSSNIYTLNENLIQQISANVPSYTEYKYLPNDLINAVVAVEDKRFFDHGGYDIIGIGRALLTNLKERELAEGGSTITQQLAKNLFLSHEKKFDRKIKELILSLKLEKMYDKEEILEMYLNVIYFGEDAYGIQNASLEFFNKNVWELSLEECAMLAGLPQAPSMYNPKKHLERAEERQKIVLEAMKENGYLSQPVDTVIQGSF